MDITKNRYLTRMRIFDRKFQVRKTRYLLQCLLLTACTIGVVLLLLNTISDTAIIAALGASSFIVFTMPGVQASKPRFLIGGYLTLNYLFNKKENHKNYGKLLSYVRNHPHPKTNVHFPQSPVK